MIIMSRWGSGYFVTVTDYPDLFYRAFLRFCSFGGCISTNAYGSLTHFLRYCITKVPSLCLKVANDSASLRLCVPACAYNVLALLHF